MGKFGVRMPKKYDSNYWQMGYGFAYASGWRGLGTTIYSPRTYKVVWFIDDSDNSEDEYLGNEWKRMNILEQLGEL